MPAMVWDMNGPPRMSRCARYIFCQRCSIRVGFSPSMSANRAFASSSAAAGTRALTSPQPVILLVRLDLDIDLVLHAVRLHARDTDGRRGVADLGRRVVLLGHRLIEQRQPAGGAQRPRRASARDAITQSFSIHGVSLSKRDLGCSPPAGKPRDVEGGRSRAGDERQSRLGRDRAALRVADGLEDHAIGQRPFAGRATDDSDDALIPALREDQGVGPEAVRRLGHGELDPDRSVDPRAARDLHGNRQDVPRHEGQRCPPRLQPESARPDDRCDLKLGAGRREAHLVIAAVGLSDHPDRGHHGPARAADLHPGGERHRVFELLGTGGHAHDRPGHSLKVPGLAVGEPDLDRPREPARAILYRRRRTVPRGVQPKSTGPPIRNGVGSATASRTLSTSGNPNVPRRLATRLTVAPPIWADPRTVSRAERIAAPAAALNDKPRESALAR